MRFSGRTLPKKVAGLLAAMHLPLLLCSLNLKPAAVYGQEPLSGGLKPEIRRVKIREDRRPVVTFKITDAKGHPLDRSVLGEARFTIAAIKMGQRGETSYQNYILSTVTGKEYMHRGTTRKPSLAETRQPDYDRGGTFDRVRNGVFTYTFKTALPPDYDKNATHVVGGELTRDNRRYSANPQLRPLPPAPRG
jgi:hypothetical protein